MVNSRRIDRTVEFEPRVDCVERSLFKAVLTLALVLLISVVLTAAVVGPAIDATDTAEPMETTLGVEGSEATVGNEPALAWLGIDWAEGTDCVEAIEAREGFEAVDGIEVWLATDAMVAWLATEEACTRAGRDAKDGTDWCEATEPSEAPEGWLLMVVVTVKNWPCAKVDRPRPVELFEIALTDRKVSVLSPKSALKSIVRFCVVLLIRLVPW